MIKRANDTKAENKAKEPMIKSAKKQHSALFVFAFFSLLLSFAL